MKFSQMPYVRPDFEKVAGELGGYLERVKGAANVDEFFAVYKEIDEYSLKLSSAISLAFIRNSLDMTDEFYAAEKAYADEVMPKLQGLRQELLMALLASPYRKEIEAAWGSLMFVNAELQLKTFTPEIVPDLQEENKLSTEYQKLIASAQIEFDGKTLTLAEIRPYLENVDAGVRKSAAEAMAGWFMNHTEKLDELFDQLVQLRTGIAKKLGHEKFTQVGYYRMTRNCYDAEMVAKFREGVQKYIVPVVKRLKEEQAARTGSSFPLRLYDDSFKYPDGNPTPKGTPEEIFAHGKKMYQELSPETAEFFDFMLENELFDVVTRPGKMAGGYCSTIPMYKAPYIFANFNGTSGDIDVMTHEAGHAYAAYVAQRKIYPSALWEYSAETAEIHSMAMEFFAWPWMEGFFKEDTAKYYYTHLADSLTFLPYGVAVDEFQHQIYDNPQMTPTERNELWKSLEAKYRPWTDLTGVPFFDEGRRWQTQMHIYSIPFYYIDYTLAQIVALAFWAEDQKDHAAAWAKYDKLVGFAGTKTFVELVEGAGLATPFVSENIKVVADAAVAWLDSQK